MSAPTTTQDTTPLTIAAILQDLADDSRFVHHHLQAQRPARPAPPGSTHLGLLPAPLDSLHQELWTHQAQAIDLIRAGRSVVVATGTGSGKSLCFQIPVAEAVRAGGTALLMYPTKALAQDQLTSLSRWNLDGLVPAAFDGDCSPEERSWVRANANAIFTNPEMLHNSILPNRHRWASFLRSLKIVVIDEMHALRGVFGSNVAHVIRRLRRAVRHYGGEDPTFVFTSATIGDADRLASSLSGLPVSVIDDDGSPQGQRDTVIWNPSDAMDHVPLSLNTETAAMAARLIRSGLTTLVFCGSRRSTEVVAEQIRRSLRDASAVRSYRGGYLREERRQIEHELFSGELRGIVATTALELGVDIGGLDAVVMSGYPGTVASFRQQLGRSGRSARPSLAVLIAGENQLDQWVCANPEEIFDRPPEPAAVSLDNPFVYVPHLGCAAHEIPLSPADATYWPEQLDEAVRQLVVSDRGRISRRRNADGQQERCVAWTGRGSPSRTISLRSAGYGEFRIMNRDLSHNPSPGSLSPDSPPSNGHLIGTIPAGNLYSSAHVGAIYLHQGAAWRVLDVDEATRSVTVESDPGDTYTLARSSKSVSILSTSQTLSHGGWALSIGDVEVSTRVTGYQIRSSSTHEVLGRESLDVPDNSLVTRAIWYTFDPSMLDAAGVDPSAVAGSLHAAEHAAIGMLPLFAICDRWDVGGLSTEWLDDTAAASIVIHDAFPGGAGMAEMAFGVAGEHLAATLDVLIDCRCVDGCPRCVQSPKCGNGNEPLDKVGAARLLSVMCGRDPEDVPVRQFVGF